jgi:hypothetical protein
MSSEIGLGPLYKLLNTQAVDVDQVRCGAARRGAVRRGAVRRGAVWCGAVAVPEVDRCSGARAGESRRAGTGGGLTSHTPTTATATSTCKALVDVEVFNTSSAHPKANFQTEGILASHVLDKILYQVSALLLTRFCTS